MQARKPYHVVLLGEDAKISTFLCRVFTDKRIRSEIETLNVDDLTLVIHDTRGSNRFLTMIEKQVKQADVIISFNTDDQQKALIQKANPDCIVLRFPQIASNDITQPFCANYLSTIATKIHAVEADKCALAAQLKAKERTECIASFISLNPITSRTMPLLFKANLPILGNFSIFAVLPKEVVSIIGSKLKEIEHQPEKREKCSIQ